MSKSKQHKNALFLCVYSQVVATCSASGHITTTQIYFVNDTIYRFTLYNNAIYRPIPYTTSRVAGCRLPPLKVSLASFNKGLDTLFNIFALHNRLQIRQELLYCRLFALGHGQARRFERGAHTQWSLR